jgi:hypothetical protein
MLAAGNKVVLFERAPAETESAEHPSSRPIFASAGG